MAVDPSPLVEPTLLHAQGVNTHSEHVVAPEMQHWDTISTRDIMKKVAEGNIAGGVMAQVNAIQPHVAVLVHAIKVDPHNRAVVRSVDGKMFPIPRHVEGQKPVFGVVCRRVSALNDKVVGGVDAAP